MNPDLQTLASEYRAIEADPRARHPVDRLLGREESLTQNELIGFEARARRKGEILAELARWIRKTNDQASRPNESGSTLF